MTRSAAAIVEAIGQPAIHRAERRPDQLRADAGDSPPSWPAAGRRLRSGRGPSPAGAQSTQHHGDHRRPPVPEGLPPGPCRGADPEIEIGRFLTEVAAFPHCRSGARHVEHRADDGTMTAGAMLQTVVQNQGDGWNLPLELSRSLPRGRRPPGDAANGPDRASGDRPSVHGGFLELMRVLGKRTAELHLALATPGGGDPTSMPSRSRPTDLRGWVAGVRAELDQTLERLAAERDRLPAHLQPAIDATLDARAVIAAAIDAAASASAGGHQDPPPRRLPPGPGAAVEQRFLHHRFRG